jgi:aminoglycoside phosphotransferase (APT) family kinase protein
MSELIARGRDGDIYAYAPGLVLRKTRDGRSIEREARIMAYVREHGYPVPDVHEVRANGSEIVMERIDGPIMMDAMLKRPWAMPASFRLLADLHDRLHEIPGPDWLPDVGDGGDRLLHLDLHPLNVMMSSRGPVVIDWTNAARGDPLTDVGFTYVLLTCPQMPAPRPVQLLVQPLRRTMARVFAKRYRGAAFDQRLIEAAELKQLDGNMQPDEIEAMRALAARVRRRAARPGRTGTG